MAHLLRFLALYDWMEPFDMAAHPTTLVKLVEDARITPTKLTVFVPEERKERRRTLTKKANLLEVVSNFLSYSWIALDEPIDRNFLNVRSHLSFLGDTKRYTLVKFRSEFKMIHCLQHLRLICESVTPRFGFAYSLNGLAALTFPQGVSVTDLDRETWQRVVDLGQSLRLTKEHLAGKLHDVYGLNVLSPPHLERAFEGRPLGAWIAQGGRGELIEIKPEVHAWIVPDEVRPTVRDTLFRGGALIATV